MRTERVTVTMPAEQVARLRQWVASGGADSLSGYVAEAVRRQLDTDEARARLESYFGGPPPRTAEWQDALAWARKALGVDEATERHSGRGAS